MLFFSSAPNILHIQLKKEKKKTIHCQFVWLSYYPGLRMVFLSYVTLLFQNIYYRSSQQCIFLCCLSLRHGLSLCCYKKDTIEWVVHKQQKFNAQSSRGWLRLLRSRHQHIQRLVRACFLSHRWPPSRLCAYGRKGREPSGASFKMALILFRRALPSWPKSLL